MKPDCANCPFAKDGKPQHQPVWGESCGAALQPRPYNEWLTPDAVLVGEGPGADEVDQGRPFVGSTGQQLDVALQQTGLVRKRYAVLNAMACRPPKGMKTDGNLRDATAACRPLFMYQYKKVEHLPTLAMGKWASAAVNGSKPITVETGRGFVRGSTIVTWHPTYAFWHNPWKAGEFLIDLARFKRLIDGKLEPTPSVIIRPSMKQLANFERRAAMFAKVLHSLDTGNRLPAFDYAMACDVETRAPDGLPAHLGKDPTRAALKSIAMGDPMLAVAHWWGNGEQGVESTYIRWLRDPRVLIIGHNWWFFDDRVMKTHGVAATNVIDTRDLRRACSATSRLSLRFLTSVYSDFAPWKETEDDK